MGALEDSFRRDQELHGEEDRRRQQQTGEPIRKVFHWRIGTRKASKALAILRHFPAGNVVTVISQQPGYFTFSEDFQHAFQVLCGYKNFDLNPQETACFEQFLEKRSHHHRQQYIQFRMTEGVVIREILSGREFNDLLNQLSQWK